jgi:hypothetical protein
MIRIKIGDCQAFGYQADDHWAKVPPVGAGRKLPPWPRTRETASMYSTAASTRSWFSTAMARS